MASFDPVKTVGLCFLRTGDQSEYFLKSEDHSSAQTLVQFLAESHAVIISLENFSDEETQFLRYAEAQSGVEVFAPSDCFGRHQLRRGYECPTHCALRLEHQWKAR